MYADALAVLINCNYAIMARQSYLVANSVIADWIAASSVCLN